MARGVGTVAVSAVLQQMVKKFPTYFSGYATLFDVVVYNGRKLLMLLSTISLLVVFVVVQNLEGTSPVQQPR